LVTPFQFASRSHIFRRMAFMTAALLAVFALSSTLAAQGTGCADTKYPDPLPTPNALVDSAHAIADLGAFADPAKPMVFSVSFAAGDSVAHVRALQNQDAAAAVTLANYVRHAHPREFWAFRVRLAGGDTPALRIERSKYCPPVSREGDVPFATRVGMTVPVVVGSNPRPIEPLGSGVTADPGSVVLVEALIAVDGHMVVGRVVQSTGNADRDASMVHDMRRLKFEPAKLDGQPIQGVFRSRGESPRP
jgi:hypothetical protein